MPVPYQEPYLGLSPSSSTASKNSTTMWGPYSSPGDFTVAMVVVLAALFTTLILALAAIAFIRYLLSKGNPQAAGDKQTPRRETPLSEALPTLSYSPGTRLAGDGAECAICLAEFVDGDAVRVLPACNHGFHAACIKGWLASRSSCPTCRQSCDVAAPSNVKDGGEVV